MSRRLFAFKIFFRPIIGWAVRQTFLGRNRALGYLEKGRFTKEEVDRLLDQSWRNFDELAPDISSEPTFGSRMNVRLAALTLAMLRSLTNNGIERAYAIELIGDTCWKVSNIGGAFSVGCPGAILSGIVIPGGSARTAIGRCLSHSIRQATALAISLPKVALDLM